MYSILYVDCDGCNMRSKGISRHLVASTLHDTYREAFFSQGEASYQMIILPSKLRKINTVTFRKQGLAVCDDKRCWFDAGYSVPHGSYLL